jgi:hypothetical protein
MEAFDSNILSKLTLFLENSGVEPSMDSPAANEIKQFTRPESIKTAFGQGAQALIAATDYLEALDSLVHQDKYAIAPWSCARGMIEASSIFAWLFEIGIDSKERVSRSLSIRYSGLREQQKLARYDGNNEKIAEIENRIKAIEDMARTLGYAMLRDKKNRRTGIGQIKPNITKLVEMQFSGEKLYRMLSGMAHSNYTTLTSLAFTKANFTRKGGTVIQRAVPSDLQISLLSQAGKIYAKCLWLKTIQFGFDAAKLAVLLEELYDTLKIDDTNKNRFWRTIIRA